MKQLLTITDGSVSFSYLHVLLLHGGRLSLCCCDPGHLVQLVCLFGGKESADMCCKCWQSIAYQSAEHLSEFGLRAFRIDTQNSVGGSDRVTC